MMTSMEAPVKQLSEEDIRKIEPRRDEASTPVTKHPVILSAAMVTASVAAIAAVMWFAGVAQ